MAERLSNTPATSPKTNRTMMGWIPALADRCGVAGLTGKREMS